MINRLNWAKPIDFFARRIHYVDHMAPVYMALSEEMRGEFYVHSSLVDYAKSKGIQAIGLSSMSANAPLTIAPDGDGPLVTCAYGDLVIAWHKQPHRPMIFMEHGVGITFNHPGYAGGRGSRDVASLFLDPNEHTRQLNAKAYPNIPGEVIGTPKMDALFNLTPSPFPKAEGEKLVVAISFHWDGRMVAPEAGNAFEHYKTILPALAVCEDFTLIGHAHPRNADVMQKVYANLGIEFVSDFEEVMKRADIYVNDCSSTMYEFCATGKPVIILNAPQFRHLPTEGIRFWEYTDIGPQVNEPEELLPAIQKMMTDPGAYELERGNAINDLYPYRGHAAERAAQMIEGFVKSKMPVCEHIETMGDHSVGIIYMAFGQKAADAVRKSMISLKTIGLDIPVCVVGDTAIQGVQFIEWKGESPYDASQPPNFQFRAGRVKPKLFDLSPFDYTLYVDADTEFVGDIRPGFALLDSVDIAVAEEIKTIGQLYNQPRAGWEINIQERDATIVEMGGADFKFLNSGVIFFRKSEIVKATFEEWHRQWLVWQQWDEQMALMRAIKKTAIIIRRLGVDWNAPHREQARVIFHNYGRGVVRSNVTA